MNGKSEGKSVGCLHVFTWDASDPLDTIHCIQYGEVRKIEPRKTRVISPDTRAICDKLDFLGRFVVAGIVRSCVKSNSEAVRLAQQIEDEMKK